MKYIRTFAVLFGFAAFYTGALILNFFVFPCIEIFARNNKKQYYSQIIYTCWGLFVKFLEFIGILKINIKNKEKLQSIKNKIIVSTHPSYIDVLILMSLIPNSTCFVKKELMNSFFMKNIICDMFIPSGLELEDMKICTKKYLDEGFNMVIFPSGIRHRKDEYPKIRKGTALTAINANKNIVPVVMYTDFDFLQIGQSILDAGEKTVNYFIEVGQEINISDYLTDDEVASRKNITNAISDALYNHVE